MNAKNLLIGLSSMMIILGYASALMASPAPGSAPSPDCFLTYTPLGNAITIGDYGAQYPSSANYGPFSIVFNNVNQNQHASLTVFYNQELSKYPYWPYPIGTTSLGAGQSYIFQSPTNSTEYELSANSVGNPEWANINVLSYQPQTPQKTVYLGQNLTSGPYTVVLEDVGQPNTNGVSLVAINLYYNGVLTNTSAIMPGSTQTFESGNSLVGVSVNSTFAGLYAYQRWAKMTFLSVLAQPTTGAVGYEGQNITNGPFKVQIRGFNFGDDPYTTQVDVFYNGVLTNATTVLQGYTATFNVSGVDLNVHLNSMSQPSYATVDLYQQKIVGC